MKLRVLLRPNPTITGRPSQALRHEIHTFSLCISSLQECARRNNLFRGQQLHSFMLATGLIGHPSSVTSLINMYSKCGRLLDALSVFDSGCGRDRNNVFAWNAILYGFVSNGLPRDGLELYRDMRRKSVTPDNFTFPCVINACGDESDFHQGRKVHAELIKFGFDSDVFVASALVNLYMKFCQTCEAKKLFDELPERDVVLWNSIINGYAQMGEFEKALVVYGEMLAEGMMPCKFTVTGILSAFAAAGDVMNGQKVHGFVEKMGYSSDVAVSNSLIDMYGKCQTVDDARDVFEIMDDRDLFSWNSMLLIYEQSGHHNEVLRLFYQMRATGFQPDSVTIAAVLPACSYLAVLRQGREIHGYIIVNALWTFNDDVCTNNGIMDMYTKCGSLKDASLVFEGMEKRDVASWNIIIMGHGLHGHCNEALNLFARMCTANVKPDEVTFVGLLSACSHAGLVRHGREILDCMERDHGVVPAVEHYACVVDMLGRAGCLEEAYELSMAMPIEPNPVIWRAFLAACRLHGDTTRAEMAVMKILELDWQHCGSYVLLSNIYGTVGRHGDVTEVRHTMLEQNVRKIPGCSWIELNTGIHTFLTGDQAHPESHQIYAKLQVLIRQLSEYGHVLDNG